MPVTLLQYKADRGLKELAEKLAQALPNIISPQLTLPELEQLDPDDVIVWCVEGGRADVNSEDLEILIWAHDFPARRANLEDRKDAIVRGVRKFLTDYDPYIGGYVLVLLQPTAFGEL